MCEFVRVSGFCCCVSAGRASCQLPFSPVSHLFLAPQKPCSGSAHRAVQTCPQAGATHTRRNSHTQYKFSKRSKYTLGRKPQKILLLFKKFKRANQRNRKTKESCRHRNVPDINTRHSADNAAVPFCVMENAHTDTAG